MSRERTLTIAGGLVALGMAGLISITAVNGGWLGLPSHYTQGDVRSPRPTVDRWGCGEPARRNVRGDGLIRVACGNTRRPQQPPMICA